MALQLRKTKSNLEATQGELGSADVDLQQTTAALQKTYAKLATTNAAFEQTKQDLTAITNAVRALQTVPKNKRGVGVRIENVRTKAIDVDEHDVRKDIGDKMPLPGKPALAAADAAFKNSIRKAEKNKGYGALVPKNSLQDKDAALIEQAMDTLTQYRKTQQRMLATAQDVASAQEKTRDGANHTRDAFKVTATAVHKILKNAQLTSAGVLKTKAAVLATRATVNALR
jgi:Asp-tRNA(Asn)/Glu-tRNA(Gln) amidotransferase C subunit